MMRSTTWVKIAKKSLTFLAVAGFWIGIWWGISALVAQELLVPAPSAVWRALTDLVGQSAFWEATALSLVRIMVGWLLGTVVGVGMAVTTCRFAFVNALFSPLLKIVRAAPVASFIILALVWIQGVRLPAFIAFLMVVPLVWTNVAEGIKRIDPALPEMAQVFGWSRKKTWLHIRVPSVMPYFLTALSGGLGFAWKSGIAAEVICQPDLSIGKELYLSKIYLETPYVFAWTAVAIALSLALEKGLMWLVRRYGKRFNTGEEG